jgi:hypothetical protein
LARRRIGGSWPADAEHVTVAREPVEPRGGEHAEDVPPFPGALVASENDRATFVSGAHELKQHVRLGAVEGRVADSSPSSTAGAQEGVELSVEPDGGFGVAKTPDEVVEGG